jgi:hypothetical protein
LKGGHCVRGLYCRGLLQGDVSGNCIAGGCCCRTKEIVVEYVARDIIVRRYCREALQGQEDVIHLHVVNWGHG